MRSLLSLVSFLCVVVCTPAVHAASVPATNTAIPFRIIPSDEFAAFVKNWDNDQQPFCAVIKSPAEWEKVFAPAKIMRSDKSFSPEPEAFDQKHYVVISRVTKAPEAEESILQVASFTQAGKNQQLVYRYTPMVNSASYTTKATLILEIPKLPSGKLLVLEEQVVAAF